MVALNHLFDNKVQGNGFIQMAEGQRALWLSTFLAKHYYVYCSRFMDLVVKHAR
jgi:hypothetical protein